MSNIDLIILGMIKQQSQSAYEIKKNIEYRNISKWVRISEQSIYKKVLQLEQKGYITSRKEKNGKMPDKAVYTVIEKGSNYFQQLMNEISMADVNIFLDFNTIIVNLDLVDYEQKKILIRNIKTKILETKELLNEKYLQREHIPEIGKSIFKQQMDLIASLENWITNLENNL